MSTHEKRYTLEQLDAIEADLRYMVFGQGFTLLLVDPSHTQRRTLANQLRSAGIDEVREAKSAGDAFVEAVKLTGEIVFLVELNMPSKDGIKFVQELRKHERFSKSKVILCSEEPRKERLVAALRSGADAFLKKPLAIPAVLEKLTEFGLRLSTAS